MKRRMESELVYRKRAEVNSKTGLVNIIRKAVKFIRTASTSNGTAYSSAARTSHSQQASQMTRQEIVTLRKIQMLQ